MKKIIVATALLFAVSGFSQVKENTETTQLKMRTGHAMAMQGKWKKHHHRSIDRFKDLNLSEQQQTELKAIFEEARANRAEHRTHFKDKNAKVLSDAEKQEMRAKRKEQMAVMDGKIKNVLTETQYSQWKAKKTQRHERFRKQK